jgi:hypothetical protein
MATSVADHTLDTIKEALTSAHVLLLVMKDRAAHPAHWRPSTTEAEKAEWENVLQTLDQVEEALHLMEE